MRAICYCTMPRDCTVTFIFNLLELKNEGLKDISGTSTRMPARLENILYPTLYAL